MHFLLQKLKSQFCHIFALGIAIGFSVAIFFFPSELFAKTCTELNGKCFGSDYCIGAQKLNPEIECSATEDCLQGCTIYPKSQNPEQQQPKPSCTANGGHCVGYEGCKATEENLGSMDCESVFIKQQFYYCCRLQTSVPAETQAGSCEKQGGFCNEECESGEEDLGPLSCPVHPYTGKPNVCCREMSAVPGETPGATPAGGIFQALPSDVQARIQAGNATLDDIVKTGVAFATFIFGLSAALFFVVFVYGGALMLLSFGVSSRVEKGKSAIKGALIGLFFVMAAWTIVRFVNDSITGGKTITGSPVVTAPASQKPAKKSCPEQFEGFSCQTLSGSTPNAIASDMKKKKLTCHPGYCPGDDNVLCCKKN